MRDLFYILIASISIIAISCSDDSCNRDVESLLQIDFHVTNDTLKKDKFLDSLSIYFPSWSDSIHIANSSSDSSLFATFSPNMKSVQMIFTSPTDTLIDTVTFYYQNEVIFLSPECGFVVDYQIDSLSNTNNIIDSISISNNKITTENDGLVEVFYL
ncbi:MAG: DUF6452 family protein [Bacteroidales bacterium]|nr:DUF6452 family protein [Bacteroidales bacterium]